jgi:hypothetical protein
MNHNRFMRHILGGTDRYGAVLMILIAVFVVLGLSNDSPWLRLVLVPILALTLDFILSTSNASRVARRRAWLLSAAVLSVALIQVTVFHQSRPYATYLASAALTLTGMVFVFRRILEHEVISTQTLFAAASVYVLIGLSFAFIMLSSAMISGPGFLVNAQREPSDYVYLSFITLTTVGFGDVTPGTNLARVYCVLEALSGQLFLATVIARLVSGFGHNPKLPTRPPEER